MSRVEFLLESRGVDYIIETRETRDFTEFVTSQGGDVCVYRVYGNNDKNYELYVR